jgi:acetoin utilization deacetylase AcuC-like enzyme
VTSGTLGAAEQRAIGFPWSEEMVERSRRSVGATSGAARAALAEGVAANLAGGTHHASASRGSGYCVFNDVAVASRILQAEAPLRIVVVDLDVHQGDGTASIFAGDPSVFTISLHGAQNFPFRKAASDLDIALPDGCGDADYLRALDRALDVLARRARSASRSASPSISPAPTRTKATGSAASSSPPPACSRATGACSRSSATSPYRWRCRWPAATATTST